MFMNFFIAGFQSRDTFSTWWSTPKGNTVVGSSSLFIIDIALVFSSTYIQMTTFARFHEPQSGKNCKGDHQALSYVKVSSETHLYNIYI